MPLPVAFQVFGVASLVTYAAAAGEMVIIDIDGYSRNTGTYTLAIY